MEPRRARSAEEAHGARRSRRPAERRSARRPAGSTREQILDAALDLFTERGYEATSLREIAEALGFTKAALYYHFERKEDLLLALHLRLHALGSDALEQVVGVVGHGGEVEAWMAVIDRLIDQVLQNGKLFLLHVRNQHAMQQIDHHEAEHADLELLVRRVLGDGSLPLPLRVRMACSIGAVMGALMGAGEIFAEVPSGELAEHVRLAVHDLMAPGASSGPPPPGAPSAGPPPQRRRGPGALERQGGGGRPRRRPGT